MISAAHAQTASGWVELKSATDRIVQITGHALALQPVKGMNFSLTVDRRSKGATSTTRQTGKFDLAATETKVLSFTSINIEPGDEFTIELKLLNHGVEVSRTTLISTSAPVAQSL